MVKKASVRGIEASTAIELDFPIVEVSQLGKHESWRKEVHRPLYHIHKWWATRLGSVFRAIILGAFTLPGTDIWKAFYEKHDYKDKIVLDPFMGSGTTLGEALKLGAKVVGCDINPVSTFLVRQALSYVSEEELWEGFRHLESTVAPEIQYFYHTLDPETGNPIPVLYFFWVKVVTTPEGEKIPLFPRYVFAQHAYPKKSPRAQIVCPKCWSIIEERYDATDIQCPHCSHRFNPQLGPARRQYVVDSAGRRYRIKDLLPKGAPPEHKLYALLALSQKGKIYLPARDYDLKLYEEAQQRLRKEELPIPTMMVRSGYNTDQARGYNYLYWRDFFNSRQLLTLGLLLREILKIEPPHVQEHMLLLFSSTLEYNNMFCSYKGEGTGAVRPIFSHHILKPERTPLENSVWGTDQSSGTFATLFKTRLLPAKHYLDEPSELLIERDLFGNPVGSAKVLASQPIHPKLVDSWEELTSTDKAALVLNGDSSKLPIPDRSVDAVVTDPPYFDFIQYSELSDFFFAWLSPILKSIYSFFNKPNSSDEGEVQHRNPRAFAQQLARVLRESARVLKDNGVLVFSFHHSRPEGWAAVCEAISKAGLRVTAAHPVHAELKAATPKSAAKEPISLDAILVCKRRIKLELTLSKKIDWNLIMERFEYYLTKLREAGIKTSLNDYFVIVASQTLIALTQEEVDFPTALAQLQKAHALSKKGLLSSQQGLPLDFVQ